MTIQQLCHDCNKIVTAELILYFQNGMLVADQSVCSCGLILWNWRWSNEAPTIQKAKEQLRLF